MKHDDPRGFTVTGGLPFYGQFACSAGALTSMVDRLRSDRTAYGVVTGNGGIAQMHSAGVYSAQPPKKVFALPDLNALQAEVNATPSIPVNTAPSGKGTVEGYTVLHNNKNEAIRGVIVGKLESGERFIANTHDDPAAYKRMMQDCVGATGQVTPGEKGQPNRFVFDN